jgi:hypothetical protein
MLCSATSVSSKAATREPPSRYLETGRADRAAGAEVLPPGRPRASGSGDVLRRAVRGGEGLEVRELLAGTRGP